MGFLRKPRAAFLRRMRAGTLLATTLAFASPVGADQVVSRIVNGITTQDQPTTAALLIPFGNGYASICSATLIGCETVLTAAHCVCPGDTFCTVDPADYSVYLQHGGIHGLSAVDVHPDYDFGVDSDAAVLTLAGPLAGIPPTPINDSATPGGGTSGTIAGYGISEGSEDDAGILRQGQVTLASCGGVAPEPEHVCWRFESPVGPPGADSNTCSGDSGGPLFVDLGAGPVVAGITSGGLSNDCLPTDVSFDTNVFDVSGFVQSIGGVDLSNTTCGSGSQVGDAETLVTVLAGSGEFSNEARLCRAEVMKHYKRYAKKRHGHLRNCWDRVQKGSLPAPCPDASTANKLAQAVAQVSPGTLSSRCPSAALAEAMLGGACASATDGNDLASCIVAAADAGVDAMMDVEYAEAPPAVQLSKDESVCQRRISAELKRYASGRTAAEVGCLKRLDKGKAASCPDTKAATRIATLAARVQPGIEKVCSDAEVASLDAAATFGGSCAGSTTTTGLAACQSAEHDAQVDALLALTPGQSARTSFVVPATATRLLVTLNAVDPVSGANDLDLYLKRGAPPTSSDFHFRSIAVGVFEAIDVSAPAADTWHVLVETFSGSGVSSQLTATTFE